MTGFDKVSDSECITSGVTRSETLVSHIEEGEEFLLLDDIRDLSPLFGSGVDTSRVVCTSVEENDRVFRHCLCYEFNNAERVHCFGRLYLEVLLQTSKVETNGLLVVVSVLLNFQSRVTENGGMVTP